MKLSLPDDFGPEHKAILLVMAQLYRKKARLLGRGTGGSPLAIHEARRARQQWEEAAEMAERMAR